MRLALAGLLCAVGWAQTARIEGRVVSTEGEPIPRATVVLNDRYTETDNDGKFEIGEIRPGRHFLRAEKAGYANAYYGRRTAGEDLGLTLGPGQVKRGVILVMGPQGVITGQVTNASGDPVEGAQVGVFVWITPPGSERAQGSWVSWETTDDRGFFRFANLPEGLYSAGAGDTRGFKENYPVSGQLGPVFTYYPGVADLAAAQSRELRAGEEIRDFNIRLQTTPVYRFRGRVVDQNGSTVDGGSVNLYEFAEGPGDVLGMRRGRKQVFPDGTFEIAGLRPGRYTLSADTARRVGDQSAPAEGPPVMIASRDATIVNADMEGLVLELRPAPRVTAVVKEEDGDDVLAHNMLHLRLESPKRGTLFSRSRPDLTFSWDAPMAAVYAVSLSGLRDAYYVKSARMGNQDLLQAPLDLTAGRGGHIEIVISSSAAQLKGVLKGPDEELSGLQVILWPVNSDAGSVAQAKELLSNFDGTFEFHSLRPGDYFLAARKVPLPPVDARLLGVLAEQALVVHLEEGANQAVELTAAAEEKLQ